MIDVTLYVVGIAIVVILVILTHFRGSRFMPFVFAGESKDSLCSRYAKEIAMSQIRRCAIVVPICLLVLVSVKTSVKAEDELRHHQMINLYAKGPRPQRLTIKVGTPVVWQSHLARTNIVVVTVAFLEGENVAQATQAVEGISGFTLESGHFVGRMEGNGGVVALKFTTPGTYAYTLGHGDGLTGAIVVRQ